MSPLLFILPEHFPQSRCGFAISFYFSFFLPGLLGNHSSKHTAAHTRAQARHVAGGSPEPGAWLLPTRSLRAGGFTPEGSPSPRKKKVQQQIKFWRWWI